MLANITNIDFTKHQILINNDQKSHNPVIVVKNEFQNLVLPPSVKALIRDFQIWVRSKLKSGMRHARFACALHPVEVEGHAIGH